MLTAAIIFLVLAVTLGGVAAAALLGKLPRNRWVGIRTDATLRDDDTFRVANQVAAPTQIAAAAALLLGGIASLTLDGGAGVTVAVVTVVAALALMVVGATLGIRTATAMPAPEVGGCGSACGSCSLNDSCDSH